MGLGHCKGGRAAGQRDKIVVKHLNSEYYREVLYRRDQRRKALANERRKAAKRQKLTKESVDMGKFSEVWSAEENAFLVENFGALTFAEIGIELGRTYHSVRSRWKRIKISKRKKLENQ